MKITLKGKDAKMLLEALKASVERDREVQEALGSYLADNEEKEEVSYPDFFQDYPVGLSGHVGNDVPRRLIS